MRRKFLLVLLFLSIPLACDDGGRPHERRQLTQVQRALVNGPTGMVLSDDHLTEGSDPTTRPRPALPCNTGTTQVRHYLPPRPYFLAYSFWSTRVGDACVTIAAGRQMVHESQGENDPNVFRRTGGLFALRDLRTPNVIDTHDVPLRGPVRVVEYSGRGYEARLTLQSLRDCSIILFDLKTNQFVPIPGGSAAEEAYRCPARSS